MRPLAPLAALALLSLAWAAPGPMSPSPSPSSPSSPSLSAAWGSPGHAATSLVPGTASPPRLEGSPAAQVWPLEITLEGPGALHRVLSPEALVSRAPEIARVEDNRVIAVSDGETVIETAEREIRVHVSASERPREVRFERDVLPTFTKMGCNAAGCHGAALGQGGFRLSLFGTDPAADHVSLTRELGARRIDRARPEESLFLLKPTGSIEHGGGKRFQRGGETWERLLGWAREGYAHGDEPQLEQLELHAGPTPRSLRSASGPHAGELVARAIYADGSALDVTDFAEFSSNDEGVALVDEDGTYTLERPGEAVFLVRFGGRVATASVRRAYSSGELGDGAPELPASEFPHYNFVDEHVNARLDELGLAPSAPSDDETFLRRAMLDLHGRLPAPSEVREFVAGATANEPLAARRERRAELVDELIADPDFDTYWAYRLGQWFAVGTENTRAPVFHDWLAQRVRQPWTQTTAQLLSGQGNSPPANFYRLSPDPKVTAENVGRIFLGTRWMCAQCHNHPFESFRQEDYYGVAAIFARLRQDESGVRHLDRGELIFPRSGDPAQPRFPDGTPAPVDGDRRTAIAEWIVAEPQLGQALANRIWKLTMGRGLVEPVDDFRSSNPPTHAALLEELGQLDTIPAIARAIATSAAYERAGPAAYNAVDDRFYAHAYAKPLDAEVFVDAVAQATGVPDSWPAPARRAAPPTAIELGDVTTESYLLDVCGRGRDVAGSTLARELHFLNGDGALPKLAAVEPLLRFESRQLIEELYLRTVSRQPGDEELEHWVRALERGPRREVAEDLLWALLNSTEFATCR